MGDLLSERAKVSRDWEDFLFKNISICNCNPFDEKNNRSGYINFGIAVNDLCNDILHEKLNEIWKCDFDSLGYKEGRGTMKIRCAVANMMSHFLESHDLVSFNDLICVTGVTSCLDVLAHCLADPGEVFLVPTPMHDRIFTDLMQRSLVGMFPIDVIADDDEKSGLTIKKIICAHETALRSNKVVRGILLINPSNLLGGIYSPELLMNIMSFCHANSLHIIVDEVYALSVYSKTEKFHSILKFPKVPDPGRTHVLYGLSNDFALAGLRIGIIHTKNKQLQRSLIQLSYFQTIPFPVMHIVATLLEDMGWCRMYVRTFQERLLERYSFCVNYLTDIGINVRESHAGFFIWADFRQFCGTTFEEEKKFFNFLMDNAYLYIGPGQEFFSAQPGWFRITFTQTDSVLKEGLRRLKTALEEYKLSKE